jgi:hypothetical protein
LTLPYGPAGPGVDPSTYLFNGSDWTLASSAQSIPTTSAGHSILVYDSTRNREVLAYGRDEFLAGSAGTWEWDGQGWTAIHTPHSLPFLTQNVSAAYSPELRATVMIDTCSGGPDKAQGQTMLFDGADWRSVNPAHWPRCFAQVAYSPALHSIVALSLPDFQTWRFDGTDWLPIATGGTVTPVISAAMGRQAPAMALDQTHDTWVVFGGFDGSTSLADTWIGNESGWTKQPAGISPSSRSGWPGRPWMAWDPGLGAVVLFGGHAGANGPNLGDTWSWDGRSWAQLAGPSYPELSPPDVASAPRLTSSGPATSPSSAASTNTAS